MSLVFREIGVTFVRMSLDFLLALAIVLSLGIASAVSKATEHFVEPGLILELTVPVLVWALLCVIWFGVGLASPMVSVALGVLPSLVISVQQGILIITGAASAIRSPGRSLCCRKFFGMSNVKQAGRDSDAVLDQQRGRPVGEAEETDGLEYV